MYEVLQTFFKLDGLSAKIVNTKNNLITVEK